MSSGKGETLFLFWHPNGVLSAKGEVSGGNTHILGFDFAPSFESKGKPVVSLANYKPSKKGFVEAKTVVSHPAFVHFLHEADNLSKAKAPTYFPDLIKKHLNDDEADVFYHVTNSSDGEAYAPENVSEKKFVVSCIDTGELIGIQDMFIEQNIFPEKLQASLLCTLGMLKGLDANQSPAVILEIYQEQCMLMILPTVGDPIFRKIDCGENSMFDKIRSELSLKDAASAKKLLYSNTFDLSDIGRHVMNPIYREIAAFIGLYEVETGQSVGQLIVNNILPFHRWMATQLANDLGMELFRFEPKDLKESHGITMAEGLDWDPEDMRVLTLLASIAAL